MQQMNTEKESANEEKVHPTRVGKEKKLIINQNIIELNLEMQGLREAKPLCTHDWRIIQLIQELNV